MPASDTADLVRAIPGSPTADRDVLPLGKKELRRKAKVVAEERVTNLKSLDVVGELVRVMRGPRLPGREKGGVLAAPQIGTPSRLLVLEDPPGEIADLSQEERELQGRLKPVPLKAIFNPRLRPTNNRTAIFWERNPCLPGYRALVERALEVQVSGRDTEGNEVSYIARDWEARLLQQGVDMLDGLVLTDRCIMRSLRALDAKGELLPPDCPHEGPTGETSKKALSEKELDAAVQQGGSRGLLAGVPIIGRPNALLAGSLLLRLRARKVQPEQLQSAEVQGAIQDLLNEVSSGRHPFGIAAPQLGSRLRIIVTSESQEAVDKLSEGTRRSQEHTAFKPSVLINPVIRRHQGSPDACFFERSASLPGYEAVVCRPLEIDVEGLRANGELVAFTVRGWRARILQHAADILDGVLYVDRMERRSFRRDRMKDEEVPADVPIGVRPVKKQVVTRRKQTVNKQQTMKRQVPSKKQRPRGPRR
eukprot:CAMPEP_0172814258 /NCGR_PEP_ID=MMETSP1075-20121228/11142_1 /TAXON_ID=2916 /ORGANISM="Ceratium fusus, Strain PA161109" /LENGTH=476 /DNA_ID=CAMNT_0013654047 /DNA_START=186 /DNA_END=1616 /DNA_ORIENTATION=-